MTSTQNSGSSATGVAPVKGEVAENVPVVSQSQGKVDTHSPRQATGRTVPSTVNTGSVWLKYSVQRERKKARESSTQV